MSQFAAVTTADARPPVNGRGSVAAQAVSTFTPATVYRAPGAVPTAGAFPIGEFVASVQANNLLAAWGGGALVPAVGDTIIDNQGGVLLAWGVIKKITAGMFAFGGNTYDVIEVDKWRKPGVLGGTVMPADGDDLGLWRGVYGTGREKWIIDWIDFTGNSQVTAQAMTICDLAGVAIPGLTYQNQAQIATNLVYQPQLHKFCSGHSPQGTTSIELYQPFTCKTANSGSTSVIGFRVLD